MEEKENSLTKLNVNINLTIENETNPLYVIECIGWTDDKHFAFNVLRNVVPVVTFNELFDNRGVIPK